MVRFLQCWPSCSLFLALSHWASNLIVGSRPRLVPKCPPKNDSANVLIDDRRNSNKNPIPVPLSQGLHESVLDFIEVSKLYQFFGGYFLGGMKQYKSMVILETFLLMQCLGWCHILTRVSWGISRIHPWIFSKVASSTMNRSSGELAIPPQVQLDRRCSN